MGAIAEAIVVYAQPLIDKTDGSFEEIDKMMSLSQVFWNIAVLPKDKREPAINSMKETLEMDDAEFEDFQRVVVVPMIRRHEQMFPQLHQRESLMPPNEAPRLWPLPPPTSSTPQKDNSPRPGRYDPCPCNSGKKYKFCCGRS